MSRRQKTPAERTDYPIEWADRLGAETISGSVWTASSGTTSGGFVSGTVAGVFLAGGTVGTPITLTNTITTSGGRTLERSIVIDVVSSILLD